MEFDEFKRVLVDRVDELSPLVAGAHEAGRKQANLPD